jgi:hypothetical protein
LSDQRSTRIASTHDVRSRSLWESDERSRVRPIQPPTSTHPRYSPVVAINGFPIDIDAWFELNKPDTFSELIDLRRALYSFRSHGRYRIKNHGEAGPEGFVLVGPLSEVLIRSHRPRYFLLRQLSRLRRKKGWSAIRCR